MVGWHHRLNGYEFEQIRGIGDGRGGLGCCGPWGHQESDTTERLINKDNSRELIRHITYPGIIIICSFAVFWTSLVAQTVKHLPTMRETWVQSLDGEDLLEKGMATHSSTLAWKIPWTEEPDRLQSTGSQRVGHD